MRLRLNLFRKIKILLILAIVTSLFTCAYTTWIIPDNLILLENEEYLYELKSLLPLKVIHDKQQSEILHLEKGHFKPVSQSPFYNPILMKTLNKGNASLKVKLFGIFPIKTVRVDVIPKEKIVVCGNTIGVKLKLDGILVVGIGEVETVDGKSVIPVKDTGIQPGDFIVQANNKDINSISELIEAIHESGKNGMHLRYRSGDVYKDVHVYPVKSIDDNKYHIGLWVRDNTAGIGTLTFYDPQTLNFGALGHGITDIDTGILLPIKGGEIIESSILEIKKGEDGIPGEIKGIFNEFKDNLGVVHVNSSLGIYGTLHPHVLNELPGRYYPIAVKTEVKEGPASILANIKDDEVVEYSIEIQKVSLKPENGSKGMVIKITDEKLLNETGGIVQGMSGSPIIQNGKIVGAVTHVLINDPTRGYGIFIENMIKKMYE
ncbi:MAG TPA: SpoIVB peptidase [Clostridiaceae bacterium]|nr:SpoIVB peptidase [Clostridiaceae bacterium]